MSIRSHWPQTAVLAIAMLLLAGCSSRAPGPDTAISAGAGPTAAPGSAARRRLLERLGRLEVELLEKDTTERRAERLALTVAIARLSGRSEPDMTDDELVGRARESVARARAQVTKREIDEKETTTRATDDVTEGSRDSFKASLEKERERAELSEALERMEQEQRMQRQPEEAARADKRKKKAVKLECPAGDPLCGGDWGGDGTLAPGAKDAPAAPTPSGGLPERVGAARVQATEMPTGVMLEVRRHFERVVACMPPGTAEQGVRLRVEVRVDETGAFRSPRALGDDLDPRVAGCIEGVFRDIRVSGSGGSRVVTVPLWLRPSR